MIFPTAEFALFFLVVYLAYWGLRVKGWTWKPFLLAASYFFYGYWDWRFVFLLVASSVANHGLAVAIERHSNRTARRLLLTVAVALNLGSIAFFKYATFLVEQVFWLVTRLPSEPHYDFWLPIFDRAGSIILPVGISFFTFQALSYVGDVYRGRMRTADSLLDFALYLALFPQLVAGPIVRAIYLVGQIAARRLPTRIDTGRAAWLILVGVFKKIVVANFLAERIVDPVFARPDLYGVWDTLFAIYAYTIQIYCDFSAYSDIAIGLCLLLGFRIPLNFDAPYFADSIRMFWRRWHISLSTFLRDYLYIPLGGSRRGELAVLRNLMITFLLGGLWHGPTWTFVIWGALHGIFLCTERLIGGWMAARNLRFEGRFAAVMRRVMVFHAIGLTCLFFRGHGFAEAIEMFRAFGRWSTPVQHLTLPVLTVFGVGYLSQLLDGDRCERVWNAYARLHPVWQGVIAAGALTAILGLGPTGVAPFIYFQF